MDKEFETGFLIDTKGKISNSNIITSKKFSCFRTQLH
jgi:hypothetical protein